MTLDIVTSKGISVSPEVSKHREGLRPFAYEDEDGGRGGGVEVSPADSWMLDGDVSVVQCMSCVAYKRREILLYVVW